MARRGLSLLGVFTLFGLAGCGAAGSHSSHRPAAAANAGGCLSVSPKPLSNTARRGRKTLSAPASPSRVPCPPVGARPRRQAAEQDTTQLVLTVPNRVTTTSSAPEPRSAPQQKQKLTFVPVVR